MSERLQKLRKENPNFDKEFNNYFSKIMPLFSEVLYEGWLFDNHIGSKDIAILAEQFITNDKGEHIGFRWEYDEVLNIAKNIVNLNETEFYPPDIWVWANVKYGDMGHLINSQETIIRYAIAELTDDDFPFYDASQRAYCWLKKHIENEEN